MEKFSASPEEGKARMELRFIDAIPGVGTTASGVWGGHQGGVIVDGEFYNLHLPSVAAALIRGALAEGWELSSSKAFVPDDLVAFCNRHVRGVC